MGAPVSALSGPGPRYGAPRRPHWIVSRAPARSRGARAPLARSPLAVLRIGGVPLSPTRVMPLTNNGIAQAPGLSLAILRIGGVALPLLLPHPLAIFGVGGVPLPLRLSNPLALPLAILRIGSVPLPLLRECPRVNAARAVPRVRVSFGDANVAVLAGAGARVGHFVVPLDGGSVAIASTEASARGSVSASPLMIIRSPSARLACRCGRAARGVAPSRARACSRSGSRHQSRHARPPIGAPIRAGCPRSAVWPFSRSISVRTTTAARRPSAAA